MQGLLRPGLRADMVLILLHFCLVKQFTRPAQIHRVGKCHLSMGSVSMSSCQRICKKEENKCGHFCKQSSAVPNL